LVWSDDKWMLSVASVFNDARREGFHSRRREEV
jgi:hypothetical protein